MGKGQELNASINYSRYAKSVQSASSSPICSTSRSCSADEIYRRDYNSFNFVGGGAEQTYSQVSTGLGTRLGFPDHGIREFSAPAIVRGRKITLDKGTFYTDPDGAEGPLDMECDPRLAGQYLCDGDR